MLTVWEAIKTRRSIRKFAPGDVPDEMIEQMLEAARLAPSASNRQPWRFLVVRDKKIKEELSHICHGQRSIEDAPVAIVCFGDLNRYSEEATSKRRQEMTDSEATATATVSSRHPDPYFKAYLDPQATPSREQLAVAPVIANTFIAIEHIVLMATALGLGTCWVGTWVYVSEFQRLFGLAGNIIPVAVIPVGYQAGELPPQRPRLDLEEILLKPKTHKEE